MLTLVTFQKQIPSNIDPCEFPRHVFGSAYHFLTAMYSSIHVFRGRVRDSLLETAEVPWSICLAFGR